MLAYALVQHKGALRADFQRYYNLNLDDAGAAYSWRHAADLAANLPHGAALWRSVNPSLAWDDATYLLARLDYDVRQLTWMLSEDGQKNVNRPQPVQTPADIARIKEKVENTDIDALREAYRMNFEGVK